MVLGAGPKRSEKVFFLTWRSEEAQQTELGHGVFSLVALLSASDYKRHTYAPP